MSGTPYDKHDTKHISEGNSDEVMHKRAIHGHGGEGSMPVFLRYVILDVIADPSTLDATKLSFYENVLGVGNISYASVAPRNSIIARRVLGAGSSAAEKVMVLYPMLPPHIALPAKPGEHVWVMFENPSAAAHELGYWVCRIVQPSFVEDVNYAHADRQFDRAFVPRLTDKFEGSDDPVYDFPNGAVGTRDGNRYVIADTISLASDNVETAYSDLLMNSDASKMISYESVPRYRKRPADIAFEGSNNTLIVLGTDRTTAASDYDVDPDHGMVPKRFPDDVPDAAGSIDIVVGRGQTADTGGTAVENSPLNKKEIGKDKKNVTPKEGDVDLKNDRSRLLVSQKTKPDKNFQIDSIIAAHASKPAISDGDGEGAVVVKSDKIRYIARHDIVIMVTGASSTDENGNVKDPDPDPDSCASIIIRTNGDIILTPAKVGIVKLGGDDADKALLCFDQGAVNAGGTVTAPPMMSTMGGFLGLGGAHGIFATRILAK